MMRLLIVEDNLAFQNILNDVISVRFPLLKLELADCVEDAKKIVNEVRPQIIFTDIRLHNDSGFDVLKYAKAQNDTTKVVMLTSFDLEEYREFARQIGADYFINKDTPLDDLLDFLADLLVDVNIEPNMGTNEEVKQQLSIYERCGAIENLKLSKIRTA